MVKVSEGNTGTKFETLIVRGMIVRGIEQEDAKITKVDRIPPWRERIHADKRGSMRAANHSDRLATSSAVIQNISRVRSG